MMWILVLVAICGIVLVACSGKETPAPPANIPPPAYLRTDLLYAYFGSNVEQIEETKDHVNAHMVMNWGGNENQLQGMISAVKAGMKLIVEIPQAYEGESTLRLRFNTFQENGLLEHVIMWYPVDEPEKQGYDEQKVLNANNLLRTVSTEHGLKIPIGVIYSADFNFPGISSYDYVGFDNYDAGDKIFTNGQFMRLKQLLKPEQKIILVPGGANPWKNDPEQFFNVAQRDMQVGLLMPFLWVDHGGGIGIRSNELRQVYWSKGMKISFPQ